MSGRNERKLKILAQAMSGPVDSREIYEEQEDISIQCASTLLKRYNGWGLFQREWVDYHYIYHLTEKGKERFWHLVYEQKT